MSGKALTIKVVIVIKNERNFKYTTGLNYYKKKRKFTSLPEPTHIISYLISIFHSVIPTKVMMKEKSTIPYYDI